MGPRILRSDIDHLQLVEFRIAIVYLFSDLDFASSKASLFSGACSFA